MNTFVVTFSFRYRYAYDGTHSQIHEEVDFIAIGNIFIDFSFVWTVPAPLGVMWDSRFFFAIHN